MNFEILEGDVMSVLPMLPDNHFQTVVTSPPYYGLRDYKTGSWDGGDPACDHKVKSPESVAKGQLTTGIRGTAHSHVHEGWKGGVCGRCGAVRRDRQLGLEATFEEFVANQARLFRDVRRVLRPDGTLWLNMGDSYAGGGRGGGCESATIKDVGRNQRMGLSDTKGMVGRCTGAGIKQKDLIGQPWALAFALRDDGWYLRADVIWSKRNPMPESVKDRPTKSHEHIFLMSKSQKYVYDVDAVREEIAESTASDKRLWDESYDAGRPDRGYPGQASRGAGMLKPKDVVHYKDGKNSRMNVLHDPAHGGENTRRLREGVSPSANKPLGRNRRSVWEMATQPFLEAHFAVFPEELARICLLATSRPGDVVLDPYSGSGTTGKVAVGIGRAFVGIELNPDYAEMSRRRIGGPLFASVE